MNDVTQPVSRTVGILAGMGPAAGVDFVRLFVAACESWLREHGHPVLDQSYPEHWMAQLPVPDRTLALSDASAEQPLDAMARGLRQLASLGATAIAIPCNTAHAWHAALQERVPEVELLHIASETATDVERRGLARVALLATEGTYGAGLYGHAFDALGIQCLLPDQAARKRLMQGIYDGVKAGDLALAQQCFTEVGEQLRAQHGDIALVMACTEIPLALPQAPAARGWTLIDPTAILANALARRAYARA
ncbi:aspartate/glutamate racemase family protein [Diaphorobacter aerolatus]|uniref:Aspartate/glutamate racemase family protein n=1 Tax=Diaphorobacter aerolatus TaxID=1288495 RepID=A0A7H0GGH4_9BURK|nr:amino acid racemase [Diaphorobacter aerolatus]QNP47390.1 aspartate/glutamate racemase family protein [Diaphorobacter aerolatus]